MVTLIWCQQIEFHLPFVLPPPLPPAVNRLLLKCNTALRKFNQGRVHKYYTWIKKEMFRVDIHHN